MYLIPLVFFLLLAFLPSLWVNSVIKKNHQPKNKFHFTGSQFAKKLLITLNIHDVKVELSIRGDHYDPKAKVIGLSNETFNNKTLSAITVSAHEVGHAIQDFNSYKPLKWRTRLVSLIAPLEKVGAGLMVLSPISILITKIPLIGMLFIAGGLLSLFATIIIHLLTIPVELDASFNRAIPILFESNILNTKDRRAAKSILLAAALTYLAAALRSLLDVARWWAILRRR
jgi:hypothetical protein